MFPTSYQLEGVVKKLKYIKLAFKTTEFWTGEYEEKQVLLKVLRVHRDNHKAQALESVSMSRDSQIILFFGVGLTGSIGIPQGCSFDQAAQTR